MPDGHEPVSIKVVRSIFDIDAGQWDACAGDADPFISHAFLSILEASGSANPESGWVAQHLTIENEAGALLACAPLYLKDHSYGEYVFDWGWADAYQRAGGSYYPKLQSAVPFIPATGRRLLVRPGAPASLATVLASGMMQLATRLGVSSVHVTFPTEAEWRALGDAGYLLRLGRQFHWENRGYKTFDDFLATLSSRKRKAIRKERRSVAESGVAVKALTGDAIEVRHWDAFYQFYLNTTDRKWGPSYLTRAFFSLLHETLRDRVVLIMAEADGNLVGGALNLLGADTLYGRNWGCSEDYKFLHFEACYYRAIDFAIKRGLKWVEAGAQGTHKIQRGYLPRTTYSAHWIADPSLKRAVARFLDEERHQNAHEMDLFAAKSPYRQEDGAQDVR
jgi:predicted N-acyltransferase